MPIRFRLRELLARRKMTAYELAKRAGLARSAVYRMVSDRPPQGIEWSTLEAICEALDVDPGDLVERTLAKRRR